MNRLATASSPYLRAHADNPVDWFPWGEEAFAEARRRAVPVLVSIGYSTCHWCHVMARESFSDPELAAWLNERFVAVKVDREEYPDVDAGYLAAASAFTQDLGWPLNVFTTPDGGPFFGGTYWPPVPVQGRASFRNVLEAVHDAWTNRRDAVESNAAAITAALSEAEAPASSGLLDDLPAVAAQLARLEDREHGGFGSAPKFPSAPVLGFLLETDVALAERTLRTMAASPLLDPVDGGFFRYATRQDWSDPHYERMLYDNALLLGVSARAGMAAAADGIARFLLDTMLVEGAVFASAQDSESAVDGVRVEGGYYALDAAARAEQPAPALDRKVLTGWNGLAIDALASAGLRLDRPEWISAAARAADWLLEHHRAEGRLARTSIDGVLSVAPATLEDYGMLATGLLRLAIAGGDVRYATAARDLVDACLPPQPTQRVEPVETPALPVLVPFTVPGGADATLVSTGLAVTADPGEGAYPSGRSAMAEACLLLWELTTEPHYREAAEATLRSVAGLAEQRPMAFGTSLRLMARLAGDHRQLVVVADDDHELVDAVRRSDDFAIAVTGEQARAWEGAGFELLASRTAVDGRATAYACRDFVCALPVHSVAELRR